MFGGCTCGSVRYQLLAAPLVVHACHCTWCQRETGSAFAVNVLIETANVAVLSGDPQPVATPSNSGRGQTIVRCLSCHVALWSHYSGAGPKAAFVRSGTLDHPHDITPDIHIFTATKRPWVTIPEGVYAFPDYYRMKDVWPADSLTRFAAMRA